jgi:hypothetical protein
MSRLSVKAQGLLQQVGSEPQLIFEIEGLPTLFSTRPILEFVRWDDPNIFWDQPGINWDGVIANNEAKQYVSLNGTSNSISQQIFPDKEGVSSIASLNCELVDKDGEVSRLLSFDNITEILSKKCTVYLGLAQGIHPNDSLILLEGEIIDFFTVPGAVNFTVSHPDTRRTKSIFTRYSSELSANIDNMQTTIPVNSTAGLLESKDALTSYIRINDEVMQIISIDSATQFTVSRAKLGTFADSHNEDDEVNSVYRLQGSPLDLALKLMHSDGEETFTPSNLVLKSINNQRLVIDYFNVQQRTGLVVGDKVEIDTLGQFTITGFEVNQDTDDSSIVVSEPIVDNGNPGLDWSYKSQYNVLNDGLGLNPNQIETQDFINTQTFFSPNFVDYDFRLQETIDNGKEFIDGQIYFPQALVAIPRFGRTSVKFLSPPLSIEQLPTLDTKNITNITKIRQRRSTYKYLYNSVLYRFNQSILEDRFLSIKQTIDGDSVNRIKTGKSILAVDSQGLRRSVLTDNVIDLVSRRFLDRYGQAATYIEKVELLGRDGIAIEVGDVVFFGGESTQYTDFQTGRRNLPVKQYEVINKSLNIKTLEPTVTLLDSGFSLIGLYGVFSPASGIGVGSNTNRLILTRLLDVGEFQFERDKWLGLVGAKIRVRSEDYSYDEETNIVDIDPQNPEGLIIDTLPSPPPIGGIVELAVYDSHDDSLEVTQDLKQRYTFNMDESEIDGVTDAQIFTIDDTTRFFSGQRVRVNSDDFTRSSQDVFIDTLVGSTVTLTQPLDFTPQVGDKIQAAEFINADGYRLL